MVEAKEVAFEYRSQMMDNTRSIVKWEQEFNIKKRQEMS